MENVRKGKVRDIYDLGEELLMVVTDRISAFDVVFPNLIPNKGIILNQISTFWFDFSKDIITNHMISTNIEDMPKEFQTGNFEGRSMLVDKLKMIQVECIVRGYLTGSGFESYKNNGSICGIKLPDNLKESEQLPEPIFTPTTKALEGHDEPISFDETTKLVGSDLAKHLRDKSIELYSKCAQYARKKGIIIADTKFEFGINQRGELVLADEALTPDSSRFWPADDYEVGRSQKSFDKQYLRDWVVQSGWDKNPPAPNLPEEVIEETANKYLKAYKMLTNKN